MKAFACGLMVLFFSLISKGQNLEIGSGLQLLRLNGQYLPHNAYYTPYYVNQSTLLFSAIFSGNIPLKETKEELYLGVNPSISVAYFGGAFDADLPVYATLKYGAGSHKETMKNFGAGVGLGGQVSAFSVNINGVGIPVTSAIVSPSVMVELTFVSNFNFFQIRFDATPVPIDKNGTFTGTVSQYNLRLMRTF